MSFGDFLDLDVRHLDDGGATVTFDAGDRHLNPGGTVHGGALATLADTAMGAAVMGGVQEGERPVTVEMKVNYLEAAGTGRLVATAEVRRRGSRFTVLECDIEQDGLLVAFATATFTTV